MHNDENTILGFKKRNFLSKSTKFIAKSIDLTVLVKKKIKAIRSDYEKSECTKSKTKTANWK